MSSIIRQIPVAGMPQPARSTRLFERLADPDDRCTGMYVDGLGATWIGSDPLSSEPRLVACYVPGDWDEQICDLARLLGMTRLQDGVAQFPFGLECHLISRRVRVLGFGAVCFQFRPLDDRALRVVAANPQLLLLMSGAPVEDLSCGIRGLNPDQLWAALVRVSGG